MKKLWLLVLMFILLPGLALAVQDRTLDCHKCGMHKAPPFSNVIMNLNNIEGSSYTDYYPKDWTMKDTNGGINSEYNSSHNQIVYNSIINSSTWYEIGSPSLTFPPTKYYFYSEDFTEWRITVSDAVDAVDTCAELNASLNAGNDVNMIGDVDCAGFNWIAPTNYAGEIDGNNYTISNIEDSYASGNAGIFSISGGAMFVHHLNLNNITLLGTITTGIFFAYDGGGATDARFFQVSVENSNVTSSSTNTAHHVGIFWGYFDGGNLAYINSSYSRHNFIMSKANSGHGGIAGHGIYQSTIIDSYSWNNTIRYPLTTTASGGFIGFQDNAAGTFTNNLAIDNILMNNSGHEDITSAFVSDTNGGSYTNNWFSNDDSETSPEATGNSSIYFNISTTAPLSSWDFTNVWQEGYNYPIFLWQDDSPPGDANPQYGDYGHNITGNLELGSVEIVYSNWTDVVGLSHYILEEMFPNGTRVNYTEYDFGCGADPTECQANATGKASPAGIHGFRFFANDSSNNWNVTPQFNLTVYNSFPQYVVGSSTLANAKIPPGGWMEYFKANFSDAQNLSMNYISVTNTTGHLINSTPIEAFSTCSSYNTNCQIQWAAGPYPVEGDYSWRIYINDTGNQWNHSNLRNFSVENDGPESSFTIEYPVGNGNCRDSIATYVHFWDDWNLSGGGGGDLLEVSGAFFNASIKTSDGQSVHEAETQSWGVCIPPYRDCISTLTNAIATICDANYTIKYMANDTYNVFNTTPLQYVYINPYFRLLDANTTYLGSSDFRTGKGYFDSLTPVSTSTAVTREYPILSRDLDEDNDTEIIVLNGNSLEIYNRSLTLEYTYPLVEGTKSNIVMVMNWTTADETDIMFFNEKEGNIWLHRISNFINTTYNFTDTFIGYRGGQIALGCGNETCVVAYTQQNFTMWDGANMNTTDAVYGFTYNTTNHKTNTQLLYNSTYTNCFSRYRNIPFKDGDGKIEATITWMGINENANDERLHVAHYNTSSSWDALGREKLINLSVIGNPVLFGGSTDYKIHCYPEDTGINHSDVGRLFSNTLVYNAGVNPANLENVVAVFTEDYDTPKKDWDFNIYAIADPWAAWTVHAVAGDQGLPGNLFRAEFNGIGAGDKQACSWCYGEDIDSDMMCMTNFTAGTEEEYDVSPDLEFDYEANYLTLGYSANQNTSWNYSEIVMRGGLFWVSGNTLTRFWNPGTGKVIVPIRDTGGYFDMTALSSTTLTYYDDGYYDGGANVTDWNVRPCIASSKGVAYWNNNTNATFTVTISDTNPVGALDEVRVNVQLYGNITGNTSTPIVIESGFSSYRTSGTDVIINFTNQINWTGTNISFIIMAQSNGANVTINNRSDYFRVKGSGGVYFEECSTSMGYSISPSADTTASQSMIVDAFEEFRTWADLPRQLFWIFFMILVVGSIWFFGHDKPMLAAGSSIFSIIALTIVGGAIGWMSGGGVFLVLLITIAGGIIIFKKKLLG